MRIRPLSALGSSLLAVERPARYLGGEYGSIRKLEGDLFNFGLCFPDLYEIGMSNNAIRIVYAGLNALDGVRCERVFAPAPDFENLLSVRELPLYTLETGIPLHELDMLGFSIGYELSAPSVLAILAAGHIPILRRERSEADPVIIAGGPAVSNPHPYDDFFDAVYIGEAEASFFDLVRRLAGIRTRGGEKIDLLAEIELDESFWIPGKNRNENGGTRIVRRAMFRGFARSPVDTSRFPIPTTRTVQEHGTVEIMRGCPNGCRFCHAGYFYRPWRVKPPVDIEREVEDLVRNGGYREITLASLSSGDYPDIATVVGRLNGIWSSRHVSFQLPSLKVESFTLPLIERLSTTRKSGLTFAVETPVREWQTAINKTVTYESVSAILEEARKRGFKRAKFYFMLGLPVAGRGTGEAEAIADFLYRLATRTSLDLSVNLGVFVPKPHTPFQRAAQLEEGSAVAALSLVKNGLRRLRNVHVSWHSPLVACVEGLIARGDRRIGAMIQEAYESGARLDAWDEHFNAALWRGILERVDPIITGQIFDTKPAGSPLPWDDISIRVGTRYLDRELERSEHESLTDACTENCTNPCGACTDASNVVHSSEHVEPLTDFSSSLSARSPNWRRIVVQYRKSGIAAFYQHLSICDFFSRSFLMNDLDVKYSEGFNPLPKLETSPPLSIGIESECEIACFELEAERFGSDTGPGYRIEVVESIFSKMPEGLSLVGSRILPDNDAPQNRIRRRSIGSLYAASLYRCRPKTDRMDESEHSIRLLQVALETRGIAIDAIIHDTMKWFEFTLRDSGGGTMNLVRILEECTATRPAVSVFSVVRVASYSDTGGSLQSLFESMC